MRNKNLPNAVPKNAVCKVCGKPIGLFKAVAVQEVDEKTNEKIGPILWFHKVCVNSL